MSTLKDAIEQKKQLINYNEDDYAVQQQEEINLSGVLDNNGFQLTKGELGGFSKEEVIAAAKFSLRAKSYGLVPGDLKVDDSPIYYNTRHKSRWFFSRKNIKKAAEKAIEKARTQWKQLGEKKKVENRIDEQKVADNKIEEKIIHEKTDKNTETVDMLSFDNVFITEMNESEYSPKSDPEYTAILQNSEAFKSIGQIVDRPDVMAEVNNTLAISESDKSIWNEHKIKQEDAAIVKKQLDTVDDALRSTLPSAADLKAMITKKIQETISKSPDLLNKKKEYKDKGGALIKRIDKMYKAVAEGELSPEAVKIFLRSELMGFSSKSERKIYESLVKRTEKDIPFPNKVDQDKYKEELFKLTKFFPHDNSVTIQGKGNLKNYYRSIAGPVVGNQTDDAEKKKEALKRAIDYVHFKGSRWVNEKTLDFPTRYYVTVKPGTQTRLLQIMNELFQENIQTETNKGSFGDFIYFKVLGKIDDTRRDNLVIYCDEQVSKEGVKDFLDKLNKKCTDAGILVDEKHTLCSTQSIKNTSVGITTSPEFDTSSFYESAITFDLFMDKSLDSLFYRSIHGRAPKNVNKPVFSYNSYITKAMLYSSEIISQKEGIPRKEVTARIKDDPEINKKFKKYVADFIRLGGIDISTMKRMDKN